MLQDLEIGIELELATLEIVDEEQLPCPEIEELTTLVEPEMELEGFDSLPELLRPMFRPLPGPYDDQITRVPWASTSPETASTDSMDLLEPTVQ